MSNSSSIKRGSEIELVIESLAYGGRGLARKHNFVIFVKYAIPGQKVIARIYKKRKGYAEAHVLKVLSESPDATNASCGHYWICSKLQNLSYKRQIDEKVSQVEDAFRRIGGLSNFTLEKVRKAESIYHYRNNRKV